jgi:uncharacterized protein (DUF2062 family)
LDEYITPAVSLMSLPKPTKEMLSPLYWWQEFVRQLQELRGRPRELSLGIAIGVFVGITPTIPLHTVLLTIPIFYYGSYQLGRFVLRLPELALPLDYSVLSMVRISGRVTVAMLHGGVLLGILPAVAAYFLTYGNLAGGGGLFLDIQIH